jgi:hypothetical protein
MKLYLVRWPNLTVSLIAAKDEAELLDTLDEVADAEGCTWKVYKGPLHLDFKTNIEFEDESKYELTPFKPSVKISFSERAFETTHYSFNEDEISDTITNMWDTITKMSFPHLWAYYEKRFATKPEAHDNEMQKQEFEKAVIAELCVFFETQFKSRELQMRNDPEAEFHKQMRVSLKNFKKARRLPGAGEDTKQN